MEMFFLKNKYDQKYYSGYTKWYPFGSPKIKSISLDSRGKYGKIWTAIKSETWGCMMDASDMANKLNTPTYNWATKPKNDTFNKYIVEQVSKNHDMRDDVFSKLVYNSPYVKNGWNGWNNWQEYNDYKKFILRFFIQEVVDSLEVLHISLLENYTNTPNHDKCERYIPVKWKMIIDNIRGKSINSFTIP
jgi:hypothetical protein